MSHRGAPDHGNVTSLWLPRDAPGGPGLEIADRLNTGIVHVNDQTLNNDAYAPFGGTGASGNGSRFGSQSSWDEFTQWQWVTARPQAHGFPF
jgi:benzaldehyde dehydrogenase (NAD)